jgi:hypothetical protein
MRWLQIYFMVSSFYYFFLYFYSFVFNFFFYVTCSKLCNGGKKKYNNFVDLKCTFCNEDGLIRCDFCAEQQLI